MRAYATEYDIDHWMIPCLKDSACDVLGSWRASACIDVNMDIRPEADSSCNVSFSSSGLATKSSRSTAASVAAPPLVAVEAPLGAPDCDSRRTAIFLFTCCIC